MPKPSQPGLPYFVRDARYGRREPEQIRISAPSEYRLLKQEAVAERKQAGSAT